MPITPEETIPLSGGVGMQRQPSLTWRVDPASNRVCGTADGLEAVAQSIDAALHTSRFQWQIYTPYFGMDWRNLLGQDPGYVAAELQRRVLDALSVDNRVLGIGAFSCSVSGETLAADLTVRTVYGDVRQNVEVEGID